MLNKFDNFIFDLDGTIINSSEEVLICFEKAFKKSNYPIDKSRLTPNVIGPPLKGIINLIAPELTDENKINEIIENYNSFYDYDEKDISKIYDGIFDVLNRLKFNGKKLFIATYKPTIPTERIIKNFNLNMFENFYTIDKFGEHITKTDMINYIIKKYKLEKNKTVMIGDAPSDMIAAKEANVATIGVLWGYGTDKTNLIENADIILNNPNDLNLTF